MMTDFDSKRASGSSCAKGCLITSGIVAVTLGLLALVALFFFVPRSAETLSGAQPGGRITGRVLPIEAARDVSSVSLRHAKPAPGGGYTSELIESFPLAADGSFVIDAPPLEGFYVLSAGAGLWIEESQSVSLLAADGTALLSAQVELELEAGCLVEVRVERSAPDASLHGKARYTSRFQDGFLFGAFAGSQGGSRGFRDGKFTIGPMPPAKGQVTITMDDGATHTFEFEVESGRLAIGIEL